MADKLIINKADVFSFFEKRNPDSNKGTYGRALLVCGSYSMAGAAIISALACVHSGVGIVDVVCPESIYPIVSSAVPEAVFTPICDTPKEKDFIAIRNSMKKCDCIVIGCGMGQGKYTDSILFFVLDNAKVPVIIDADGINALSVNIDILVPAAKRVPIILTPHPGEMSRLINRSVSFIQDNRQEIAVAFAKNFRVTLVLKGNRTVVAFEDGSVGINLTGNAGMATAGSGDMLCGIMAAFIAGKMDIGKAVCAAVYIHGLCGDISAEKKSMIYSSPTTMIPYLADVFKELEQEQNKTETDKEKEEQTDLENQPNSNEGK